MQEAHIVGDLGDRGGVPWRGGRTAEPRESGAGAQEAADSTETIRLRIRSTSSVDLSEATAASLRSARDWRKNSRASLFFPSPRAESADV